MFVFPYPSRGVTFRFPAIFACCSGELNSRGIDAAVVELYLDVDDPVSSRAALAGLADFLRLHEPRVAVLSDVFEPSLFDVVREACAAIVVSTDGPSGDSPGRADFGLERFETNPVPLLTLVEALVRGTATAGIPNVRAAGGGEDHEMVPCGDVPMFSAPPDYEFLQIPGNFPRPSQRLSVYVNPGCPWSRSVVDNPVFAGADLTAPGLALRGCSFCIQDGRYSGLDAESTVQRILLELECWTRLHPDCREVVLWDESPWRFLPLLVEKVASSAAAPIAVCFHARADDLVRHSNTIEAACALARRFPDAGVTLAVTLIGFENYSAVELARMNKGSSPEDVRSAARTCRLIADKWPDVFEFDRFRASSFILFTPWTTRSALEENIRGFNGDDILEFSTGMALSKLRLYPGLPILALAARDGLVSEGYFDQDLRSSRRFGYSTDIPWRFSDPDVEKIYRLYLALYPMVDRHEQVDLLDWVVRAVFDGDAGSLPAGEIAALMGRLRGAVASLNGQGGAGGPSRQEGGTKGRSGTLEVTLSGAGVPGPDRMPDAARDPSPGRLAVRISRYGATAAMIHVIGREPGRSPVLLRAVYLARQSGIPRAAVRTDGTVFADPAMLARAIKAGVTDIEFRIFGTGPEAWGAVTGDAGSFDTFRRAAALVGASSSVVRSRGLVELGLVTPAKIREVVEIIHASGLGGISWEAPVAYLPTVGLTRFVESLEACLWDSFSRNREHP